MRARPAALSPDQPHRVEDHWISEYAAAGTPAKVAEHLGTLPASGSTSLGL